LLARDAGQRGRLSRARVRRSVSTNYYALFHFLLDEIGQKVVGTHVNLLERRRILARTISHRGLRTTFDKVRGRAIEPSLANFLRPATAARGDSVAAPTFIRDIANAFIDAQDKRHEADYDLNESLSEADASVLLDLVRRSIKTWGEAASESDRDFKHALCVLILLRGQLRSDP